MSQAVPTSRSRRLLLTGIVLMGCGGIIYGLHRSGRADARLIHHAQALYQSQRYADAITAYEHVLQRSATPGVRLNAWLFGPRISPDRVRLHIANSHYRQAEAVLHRYQEARRDPRVAARPALASVQRAFATAVQAYDRVSQRDPHADVAAQANAARAEAWQLLLTAAYDATPGRRSLSQRTAHTIERAEKAVETAHQHRAELQRQDWMTAVLLLETLTAFSQRPHPPSMSPDREEQAQRVTFGDLLLRDTAELDDAERRRFEEFFFALPLEASNPWPTPDPDAAGSGHQPHLH
ncbi:MAG: tetratricopeptide repeat protein [Candidatus Tectomicrobia bacterium]|nr:tetratricopeptide repeat protein [Candidatus Tectomicrobia bacterium]